MLHTKVKLFSLPEISANQDIFEVSKDFENEVNKFIKDKNVKNIIQFSPGIILVHYNDSTY